MTAVNSNINAANGATTPRLGEGSFDIMGMLRSLSSSAGLDVGALRSALDMLATIAPDLANTLRGQLDALLSPVERGQLAASPATANPTASVTVARGDTLSRIAARAGVSLDALLAANPQFDAGKIGRGDRTSGTQGRDPDRIAIGERINLPEGARQSSRVATADQSAAPDRLAAQPSADAPSSPRSGPLDPGAASGRAAEQAEARVRGRASSSQCYKFVKEALQRAGVVSDYIPGVAARGAGPALEARGFTNILPGSNIRSPYDAPVGAVLVYGAAPGATDRNARYGHIELRTPNGFASDYFSARARTGDAAAGLDGRGRVLIGVYVKPDAGAVQRPSAANPVTAQATGGRLGDLSMIYETGRRPSQYRDAAGVVSSGRGDPGGKSYGAYQLASRTGTLQEFLRAEGSRWANEFRGMDPTRPGAFEAKWREIAAREPEAFFNAQHDFIQRTKYDRVVATVLARTGVDINTLPPAVRDAVWSMSVQHGRAAQLVTDSIRSVQRDGQLDNGRAIINRLYDDRTAYVNRIELPAATRSSLIDRYVAERSQALSMLR